jgi:phage portal protein BeeE
MRIPTISRARDLHAGLIATTPLRHYRQEWNGEELEELPLPPESWMLRPDRRTTFAHVMAWTFDDLYFYGAAYWHIDARYASGFPSSMSWIPATTVNVQTPLEAGNYPIGGIQQITVSGQRVPTEDVIIFYSPTSPLLEAGARAIVTAERLEQASQRFSTTPTALGYLKQTSGEPMTGDELSDLAEAWTSLREESAVAALNQYTDFVESSMDPSKLQLVEARQHQALELARVANVSPFLVGAPNSSGFTYQNAEQARAQLAQDAIPYLSAIEETLSSDQVTPRGHVVRFDRSIFEETAGVHGGTPPAPEENIE